MFSGPPLPLPPNLPLRWLSEHARLPGALGAWVRESTRTLEIHYSSKSCLLIGPDLGLLLGRCSRVALREGTEPVVLAVDRLIQWRALQVVMATPFLPGPERLGAILRGAHVDPTGFRIPLGTCSPEQVLAECVAHGIEVAGSRIIYWLPPTLPRPAALDRVPPAASV
jgi:hypothetical protein